MEEMTNEPVLNKKVWLNSLKIFAITLGIIIFVFFFAISAIFFISPKIDAKIFNFLGLKKAEEACYVQAYEKSGSNVDLYNLIIFESELENHEKELMYINELINDEDYQEFCQKLDKSALASVEDKSLIAYVCNTNGYLINQKLKCMYELGFDEGVSATVRNYVKSRLSNDFMFDTSFVTYVELVRNDNDLTAQEKKSKIEMVYDDTALKKRLSNLQDYIEGDILLENRIIAQNSIMNIRRAVYMIDLLNESSEVESSKTAYESALAVYNDLVK